MVLHRDLQGVARRLVICGMHVHIGLDEDELRIDLMTGALFPAASPGALDLLPFWQGEDSGLKSIASASSTACRAPACRSKFESYGEYRRHIDVLIEAGLVEDATKLWWDIRPSERLPDAGDAHLRHLHAARRRHRHRRL